MATTMKSLRIDNDLLDIIEDIKDLYKVVFGLDVNTTNILLGAIERGAGLYIDQMNVIFSPNITTMDGKPLPISENLRNKFEELVRKYQDVSYVEVDETREVKGGIFKDV